MAHFFTAEAFHVMVQGFLLWVSLMVAIGPQNALVIKQGLRRHALGAVLLVCIVSDLILVVGGIAGVDFIVGRAPWLLEVLRWAGVAFLLWFAFVNFKEARNPQAITAADMGRQASSTDATPEHSHHESSGNIGVTEEQPGGSNSQVATLERTASGITVNTRATKNAHRAKESIREPVLAAIAMSWLNPGAFVDGFVMLGGVANQYGDLAWALGVGALTATLTWFPALGFGARAMSRHLAKPTVWQKINIGIGLMMLIIAGRLVMGI